MSTFLIASACVACLLAAFVGYCCLVVGKLADVQEAERETLGDYWTLHRHNDLFVVVLKTRGETFCWSYRAGYELDIVRLIWADYESGLLTRDEAAAIGEMVAGSSLQQLA